MLLALEGKNKIGFIDGSYKRSNIDEKHNQLLKLMQFLMGLDDSYMQIRSSILHREALPDVRSAYAAISSKESHRVARNNQNFNVGPSRPNNVNNNRQGGGFGLNNNRPNGGSDLVCENYGFNGHTIDRCFKIIGYPADFGKKKSGQHFKKQIVFNNNYVGKSLSFGFRDEEMATLISCIKDNKVRKNMQANMAVGHPNGTEAYISKIGNLRLSNGLTLYDILVIPEYYDLNLKNILGIGEQCEGLYYYSDKDPVLNVLKDSLNFDRKDNTANDLNKGKSDSSSSSESGSNINQVDYGNDADSSNDFVATQNEEVATLEEFFFSEGNLEQNPSSSQEVVYMKPQEGYFSSDNKVCRLKKSLYGLKQAHRQWNAKLTSTLIENGSSQSKSDYSLYTKSDKGVFLALLVYVDDIIITDNSVFEIEKFKLFFKSKFLIKDLDILTKGLDTIQHLDFVKKLGMYDVYQVETKRGILRLLVSIGNNKKVQYNFDNGREQDG
nr:ribonuclease H-like domain-containing protein [Tanacetum cinerariifolium]